MCHTPVLKRVSFLKLAVWSTVFALVSFYSVSPVLVSVVLGPVALVLSVFQAVIVPRLETPSVRSAINNVLISFIICPSIETRKTRGDDAP